MVRWPEPVRETRDAADVVRTGCTARWWVNDPDCLLVRDTDTALNLAETRFLATSIALSGGMVVASDDLPKLPDDRRALAAALFPPAGIAARPLDAGDGPTPHLARGPR